MVSTCLGWFVAKQLFIILPWVLDVLLLNFILSVTFFWLPRYSELRTHDSYFIKKFCTQKLQEVSSWPVSDRCVRVYYPRVCVCTTNYACVCVFVRAPAYPPTRVWVDGSSCTRACACVFQHVCVGVCGSACAPVHRSHRDGMTVGENSQLSWSLDAVVPPAFAECALLWNQHGIRRPQWETRK